MIHGVVPLQAPVHIDLAVTKDLALIRTHQDLKAVMQDTSGNLNMTPSTIPKLIHGLLKLKKNRLLQNQIQLQLLNIPILLHNIPIHQFLLLGVKKMPHILHSLHTLVTKHQSKRKNQNNSKVIILGLPPNLLKLQLKITNLNLHMLPLPLTILGVPNLLKLQLKIPNLNLLMLPLPLTTLGQQSQLMITRLPPTPNQPTLNQKLQPSLPTHIMILGLPMPHKTKKKIKKVATTAKTETQAPTHGMALKRPLPASGRILAHQISKLTLHGHNQGATLKQ